MKTNTRKSRKNYYEQQRALREEAQDFQREMQESSPSWWEIADYQSDLERRAKKCGLVREFRENGII